MQVAAHGSFAYALSHSRPHRGRLTPLPSVGFGTQTTKYLQEQAWLKERQLQICNQVYYDNGEEQITGLDVLKAIKKAGYKKQLNPLILLNPVSWLFKLAYAWQGDGFSQRVIFTQIMKNLPLRYEHRSSDEQQSLEYSILNALKNLTLVDMAAYLRTDGDFFYEGWRPLAHGNQILRNGTQILQKPKADSPESTTQDLAPKLKRSLDELLGQKHQRSEQLAQKLARIQSQKEELAQLQASKPEENGISVFDNALRTQLIEQKQEMIEVLSQQYSVTEALTRKQDEETNQVILKLHRALHQITINTEISETLIQTHQLQEKAEINETLALQLAQIQVAYDAIKQALQTQDPGQFIALMQKVQALYKKLEGQTQPESDLLKQMQQEIQPEVENSHS